MKKAKVTGALVAAAVASLIMTGQVMAEEKAATAKVKCTGINECKGKSACKGGANACSGHNECKGKGVTVVGTEKECTDKGGKVEH